MRSSGCAALTWRSVPPRLDMSVPLTMTESFQLRPEEIHVEVGHDVAQRHRRMADVVRAAPESLFLAARHQEQQRPVGPGLRPAERFGQLQQPGDAGGVVVRPVEDAVGAPGPHADVVEVGGDRHVLVPQSVVSSLQYRREVRRRRSGEIVSPDPQVYPQPWQLAHHRRVQRPEPGEVELIRHEHRARRPGARPPARRLPHRENPESDAVPARCRSGG